MYSHLILFILKKYTKCFKFQITFPGYDQPIIAAQAPKSDTVEAFWQLVWDTQVNKHYPDLLAAGLGHSGQLALSRPSGS